MQGDTITNVVAHDPSKGIVTSNKFDALKTTDDDNLL